MKILGYIPARIGSKGIKRKNLAKLNGKPLIYYTVKFAKKMKPSIYPFVSTDSRKILNYTNSLLKEKNNYIRPKSLSTDKSKHADGLLHAIKWLKVKKKLEFDAVMLLQPTSPIREISEMRSAINAFKKSKTKSLLGVRLVKEHPSEMIKYSKSQWGFLIKHNFKLEGRQNYKRNFYKIDGSLYICKVNFIKKNKLFFKENNSTLFVLKNKKLIDIDSNLDLKVAENLLKSKRWQLSFSRMKRF